MGGNPETRASLLARLADHTDHDAWREFVAIYRPVVLRIAHQKGMQDADAEDLAQQVMAAVAKAIERWEPDESRARFRTWLHRITHNLIVNALTRSKPDRGSGSPAIQEGLNEHAALDGPDSRLVELEIRRQSFLEAARRIRREFHPDSWAAFWMTAVDGIDAAQAAQRLGKTTGAVYAARSRVMHRLREKVREYHDES